MRGTLLNTATVAVGGFVGWRLGDVVPDETGRLALAGLGLVTVGLGLKQLLGTKSFPGLAVALVVGGVLGHLAGIPVGIDAFAAWARETLGGTGRFQEAVVLTSVLFCIGPMTLLGCLRDGIEGDIELLAVKSTLDGFAALMFAAAMGPGVLVTAFVVLVFQGALTLLARPLKRVLEDESLVGEMVAVGGAMLVAIGFGLLEMLELHVSSFLPALALAPIFAAMGRVWRRRRESVARPVGSQEPPR
ncbi:MAG: DUF554 domain-containing protein [Fimbriimonadaceae bacterium]